jgi:hypothetical protein
MKHYRHYLLFACTLTLFTCGAVQWRAKNMTPIAFTPRSSPISLFSSEKNSISNSSYSQNPTDTEHPYAWLTFIGSDKWDWASAAELDANGNLYVVVNHYTSNDGLLRLTRENEISITRITGTGEIAWETSMPAGPYSWGEFLALDDDGNIYISGISSDSWGEPLNPFSAETSNMFIAKYSSSDGSMVWNTFVGSNVDVLSTVVASDENRNIYVAWAEDDNTGTLSYFLAKLDSDGVLQWSKAFVPSEADSNDYSGFPVDIKLNENGDIYVLSVNNSTWGDPIRGPSGSLDSTLGKFDNTGELLWNTFLGGTGEDPSFKLELGDNGYAYVSGYSEGTWGNPVGPFNEGPDGFIAKLDTDGFLVWNTFVGGATGFDSILDMEIDTNGNIYFVGYSGSTWGNPENPFSGTRDGFVAQMDPNGSILWNTFIGAGSVALVSSIEIGSNSIMITGASDSSFGNPIIGPQGGGSDIFVAKINLADAIQAPYRDSSPLIPVLTTYIPTPLDISTDPSVIGANILLAVVLMLPFAVAVGSFSQTVSENEENLTRWIPPLAWMRKTKRKTTKTVNQVTKQRQNLLDMLSLIGVAVFYGIVFSLLDETWQPFTTQGLVLLGSMTFSSGVIGFLGDILQWRALRKWEIPAEYNLRAASILLSVLSVGISRAVSLLPGLMFGSPEVLEVDEKMLNERQNQSLIKISSTTYLVMALGAWLPTIATTLIQREPISDSVREIIGGVEAFLLVIFAVALEFIFLELLAVSDGLGTKLKRSNLWIWAISLALCTFFFLHTLLNPRYDLVEILQQSNITLYIGIVIVFIVIAFVLRWISRKHVQE